MTKINRFAISESKRSLKTDLLFVKTGAPLFEYTNAILKTLLKVETISSLL